MDISLFFKGICTTKKIGLLRQAKTTAKDQKTTAKGPLAYCGGSARQPCTTTTALLWR